LRCPLFEDAVAEPFALFAGIAAFLPFAGLGIRLPEIFVDADVRAGVQAIGEKSAAPVAVHGRLLAGLDPVMARPGAIIRKGGGAVFLRHAERVAGGLAIHAGIERPGPRAVARRRGLARPVAGGARFAAGLKRVGVLVFGAGVQLPHLPGALADAASEERLAGIRRVLFLAGCEPLGARVFALALVIRPRPKRRHEVLMIDRALRFAAVQRLLALRRLAVGRLRATEGENHDGHGKNGGCSHVPGSLENTHFVRAVSISVPVPLPFAELRAL